MQIPHKSHTKSCLYICIENLKISYKEKWSLFSIQFCYKKSSVNGISTGIFHWKVNVINIVFIRFFQHKCLKQWKFCGGTMYLNPLEFPNAFWIMHIWKMNEIPQTIELKLIFNKIILLKLCFLYMLWNSRCEIDENI